MREPDGSEGVERTDQILELDGTSRLAEMQDSEEHTSTDGLVRPAGEHGDVRGVLPMRNCRTCGAGIERHYDLSYFDGQCGRCWDLDGKWSTRADDRTD